MLELGKHISGFFNLTRISGPDDWTGHSFTWFGRPRHHDALVELMMRWEEEFLSAESELSHLPDGWADMSRLLEGWRSLLADPLNDVGDDGELLGVRLKNEIRMMRLKYVPVAVRAMRHSKAIELGKLWHPIWARLMPALRGKVGRPKVVQAVGTKPQQFAALFEANRHDRNFSIIGDKYAALTDDGPARMAKLVREELERIGSDIRVEGINSKGRHGLVRSFKNYGKKTGKKRASR